ncbi:MAG: dienelactone hydrolase family protein [Nitrospinae bacterium]|nr:dienelactone hydrolase family protein [Nitrospinota bacterium]
MPVSWVDIKVDGQTMEGYLTQPASSGRYPAVVVIQEIWGVNSHIQTVTDRLPSQGYVGLAPGLFHREGRMTLGLYEEMDTALARLGGCADAHIIADVTGGPAIGPKRRRMPGPRPLPGLTSI